MSFKWKGELKKLGKGKFIFLQDKLKTRTYKVESQNFLDLVLV